LYAVYFTQRSNFRVPLSERDFPLLSFTADQISTHWTRDKQIDSSRALLAIFLQFLGNPMEFVVRVPVANLFCA
jgi:hypothetical protein